MVGTAHAQSVPLNIAIVDFEKVLRDAQAPQSIKTQVNQMRTNFGAQIKADEEALRVANQELAQKKTLLAADAYNAERRAFEQKVRDVQQKVQSRNIALQNAQQAALAEVQKALSEIVLKIAEEKSYTLVLRRAQTVVVADPFDITQEVIANLNAKLPTVNVVVQ